jgi:hypothetical protein
MLGTHARRLLQTVRAERNAEGAESKPGRDVLRSVFTSGVYLKPFGLSVAPKARSRSLGATCQTRARFDEYVARRGCGDCEFVHGIHPFALRATGPAFGCPILFQTKLSLAEAGRRSEQRRSRWPEGRGAGSAESPEGSSTTSLRQIRKTLFDGVSGCVVVRGGLFGPSMGRTPSRCALRGQPSAVQFCSRQFCRTGRVRPHLSPPDTQNAPSMQHLVA